jgi:hypothetical protein
MTGRELSDHERGILISGMSPWSAGMMLGRSAAWVERQRANMQALAAVSVAEAAPLVAPEPEPQPEPEPEPVAVVQPAPAPPVRALARETLPPKRTRNRPEPRTDRSAPTRPRVGVTRIKPVTARVLGWASAFLDARWPLDEVAELFDVHPDALVDALEHGASA